jgi:hypothetical protein
VISGGNDHGHARTSQNIENAFDRLPVHVSAIKEIACDQNGGTAALTCLRYGGGKYLQLLSSASLARPYVKTREGTAEVEVGGVEKTQLAD